MAGLCRLHSRPAKKAGKTCARRKPQDREQGKQLRSIIRLCQKDNEDSQRESLNIRLCEASQPPRSNLKSMEKQFYVYMMTNPKHSSLYTGVTSDIQARAYRHKEKVVLGFTSRYNVNMLVYFEELVDAKSAIAREKQIKNGSRQDKVDLINGINPLWCDLYEQL